MVFTPACYKATQAEILSLLSHCDSAASGSRWPTHLCPLGALCRRAQVAPHSPCSAQRVGFLPQLCRDSPNPHLSLWEFGGPFLLAEASRQVPSLARLSTSTLAFPASPWRCLMLTFLPVSKGHSTTETPLCTVHSVQPHRPPGRPCHVPVSGPALRLSLPGVLAEWPPRACCSISLPCVAVPP